MKNKFQKSVLERQEAAESLGQEPTRPATTSTAENKTHQPDAAPNIGGIRLDPARTAKNKTFYLDEDVIRALGIVAKDQKVTDSKLVNAILRSMLIEGAQAKNKNGQQ